MEIPNSRIVTFDEVDRAWVPAGVGDDGAGLVGGEPPPRRCRGADVPTTVANKRENPLGHAGGPGRHEVGCPGPEGRPVGLGRPRHGAVDRLLQPPGQRGGVRRRCRGPRGVLFKTLRRRPASVVVPAAQNHDGLGLGPEAARQDRCPGGEHARHGCLHVTDPESERAAWETEQQQLASACVRRRAGARLAKV